MVSAQFLQAKQKIEHILFGRAGGAFLCAQKRYRVYTSAFSSLSSTVSGKLLPLLASFYDEGPWPEFSF